MPGTVRSMVLPPGVAFACWMAERSVTMPGPGLRTSARLFTLKTAGTQRSSSDSRPGRVLRERKVLPRRAMAARVLTAMHRRILSLEARIDGRAPSLRVEGARRLVGRTRPVFSWCYKNLMRRAQHRKKNGLGAGNDSRHRGPSRRQAGRTECRSAARGGNGCRLRVMTKGTSP